jgi:hypothetical protein
MSEQPPSADPRPPSAEELDAAATINVEALKRWFSIPEGASVALYASRADLDRLFLGLRMLAFSTGDHLAAFQLFSHGDIEAATKHFNSAAARNYQAIQAITELTSALMTKVQVIDG